MLRVIKLSVIAAIIGAMASFQANAEDPYLKPDGSWVSISGTVVDPQPHSFTLDYGEGLVTVEMDDWDWDADGYKVFDGDKVTVYGRIDDDFFELTTIEASSVYVEGLNTYFYASAADEESVPFVAAVPVVASRMEVIGTVTAINGREFTLDTGLTEMSVDTIAMVYNPLDDSGYQQIDVGDRVKVAGNLDINTFDENELAADYVITLQSNL